MPVKDYDFNDPESQFDWGERMHYYYYLGKLLLRKFWWILLLTTSAGVLFQGYKVMNTESTFTSSAKLMLSGFVANPVNVSGIQEQFGYWFGNQRIILESPDVRRAAQERVRVFRPDLEPSGVSIRASQIPETAVIQINAQGDSREYTQAYLNALIEEFMNIRQQMKGETSERALLAIAERLDALEDQIQRQENAVVEFRKDNNLIFIQEQGDSAGSNLARLKNRRAEIRTQIRLLETVGLDADMQTPEILGIETIIQDSSAEQNFQQARRNLDQLRAQREEFGIYLKERHPRMIQLNEEISRTRNLLAIYRAQALEQISERRIQLQAQLDNLDIIISEQEVVALENSRLSAEFERLNANLTRSRNLYENLLRSIQNLETGQQIDPEIVTILERASYPFEIKESIYRRITEGFFAGFIGGAALIVGLGFLDSRILSADDLKRRFDIQVLGTIPYEKSISAKDDGLLHAKDKRHLFAEACRTLRSSIFFMGTDDTRPKTVLITSSVPGEGKSTVAANLSVAVSLTSARTVLVDCDLRRGQLSDLFKVSNQPGLSELLQQGRRLETIIQQTEYENLDIISTGNYPERPGELLLSHRMEQIIEELKEQYDYVVLDSAPLLATDDTTGFSVKADTTLFVVRSSSTQSRQVKTAVERLRMRGANMGGFILNCVDTKGTDYYYYKKYNEYYAYSPR